MYQLNVSLHKKPPQSQVGPVLRAAPPGQPVRGGGGSAGRAACRRPHPRVAALTASHLFPSPGPPVLQDIGGFSTWWPLDSLPCGQNLRLQCLLRVGSGTHAAPLSEYSTGQQRPDSRHERKCTPALDGGGVGEAAKHCGLASHLRQLQTPLLDADSTDTLTGSRGGLWPALPFGA